METETELDELVRYHGALDVLRALRRVANEAYGDPDTADAKCHQFLLDVIGEGR